MKKILLIVVVILLFATAVYAACTLQFITLPDGTTLSCIACCDNYGNCTTSCS